MNQIYHALLGLLGGGGFCHPRLKPEVIEITSFQDESLATV